MLQAHRHSSKHAWHSHKNLPRNHLDIGKLANHRSCRRSHCFGMDRWQGSCPPYSWAEWSSRTTCRKREPHIHTSPPSRCTFACCSRVQGSYKSRGLFQRQEVAGTDRDCQMHLENNSEKRRAQEQRSVRLKLRPHKHSPAIEARR